MAFKTLKTKNEAIGLAALGEEISARRAAVGKLNVPRNAGSRRTAAEAALIEQIAKIGGRW
jgi:hypothetical protein